MGAVLAAVSPAVVVPRMIKLIEEKCGTAKSIPQLILAGASCDDIFVVVLFSAFAAMAQGGRVDAAVFMDIPLSIVSGLLLGACAGIFLSALFESAYSHDRLIRNSMKVIIILGTAFLLMSVEIWMKDFIAVSGLLAVVSMACMLKIKSIPRVAGRLSEKFGKLWLAAEVMLFVLVGAAVDIRYTFSAGIAAAALILSALLFRAVGVMVCLIGTSLDFRERMFCVIAYLPKATVQAAMGAVPLSMGMPRGKLILSVAVVAILLTAPIGALGIDRSYKRLLKGAEENI